jgi:hypothetical protein
MAKKNQPDVTAEELGGLPPELQVGAQDTELKPTTGLQQETFSAPVSDHDFAKDEESPDQDDDDTEFVVVSGNTVRHNGTDYSENAVIYLDGEGEDKDAERLLQLGVIVRYGDLKAALLSHNAVTVQ